MSPRQPSSGGRSGRSSKPRGRYRLIAGIHVGPDYSQEPSPVYGPDREQIGEKYPSKTYRKGDIIESEKDLAEWDRGKFEKVGGFSRMGRSEAEIQQRKIEEGSPTDQAIDREHMFKITSEENESTGETRDVEGESSSGMPGGEEAEEMQLEEAYGSFDHMTNRQLQDIAQAHGVDMPGATRKEEYIKFLRKHDQKIREG